jgi:membrane protease YdiL (CAAX protease family)
MSVSSVLQQPFQLLNTSTTSSEKSTWTVLSENLSNPGNWVYLVPTIGALALCVFLAPMTAPIGMAVGVGTVVVSSLFVIVLKMTNLMEEDKNSEYSKYLEDYPFIGTLVAPVLEEGFFRGLVQPLATHAILFIVPAAAAAFLGTGLSIAVIVSIVATATIFGLVHCCNNHKNSHIQAIAATFGGIALGLVAAQFGLPVAIAAHIVHNTILMTIAQLIKDKTAESTQTSLSPQT